MKVVEIDKVTANEFVSRKHYRKSLGMFWEAYGLVIDGKLEGVVVYGQPSPAIQKHAFKDRDFRIYELTRLVIQTNRKNAASFLVANSLKMLKDQPCAVVSYADAAMSHIGYVYQATNWLYTGRNKSHTKLFLVNGKECHSKTIQDRFGITDPERWAKENGIKVMHPEPKHRYFYFVGTRKQKKEMLEKLKYPIIKEYPKGTPHRYDAGPKLIIPMNVDDNILEKELF